jgi:N-glycosylase/DNA lyase
MSKQVYEEVQEFLLDKWGPMGGWCQAVMFATDLPPATVNRTPRELVKTVVKQEIESVSATTSPASPMSTAGVTPAEERPAWNGQEVSPLKGRGKKQAKRKGAVELPITPTREVKPELHAAYGFKRTRSAARAELLRATSGVSVVAVEVEQLEVN